MQTVASDSLTPNTSSNPRPGSAGTQRLIFGTGPAPNLDDVLRAEAWGPPALSSAPRPAGSFLWFSEKTEPGCGAAGCLRMGTPQSRIPAPSEGERQGQPHQKQTRGWGAALGRLDTKAPRSPETSRREHPCGSAWIHCPHLPWVWRGPDTPSLRPPWCRVREPSASTQPQAQGTRDPVWYKTSVMSYMQIPSSAKQAKGLSSQRTTPFGDPRLDLLSLGNDCCQTACLRTRLRVCPREICPGFRGLPCSFSLEAAVGPGEGNRQTNPWPSC